MAGYACVLDSRGSTTLQRGGCKRISPDGSPYNRQATGFCREYIDLISPLPHITEQAFDGIGRLNVPMHAGRELVKRQQVLFVLSQAADRFGIALAILRECSLPVAQQPLSLSAASKCRQVRPVSPLVLAWG